MDPDAMRKAAILLVFSVVFICAERLPAPIVDESATPSRTESGEQRPKPVHKSVSKPKKAVNVAPAEASPAKRTTGPYVGTWQGIINCGIWGNLEHVIVIDDSQTTMRVSRGAVGILGPYDRTVTATIGSEGITGQLPGFDGKWTLLPYPDGKTALVKLAAPFLNSSAIFRRTSEGSASIASPQPTAAVATDQHQLPTAKPVPGKPGFVYNPFNPSTRILLDVRGHPSGSTVKDPGSGKLFIVP
jgi:hypothetical protein